MKRYNDLTAKERSCYYNIKRHIKLVQRVWSEVKPKFGPEDDVTVKLIEANISGHDLDRLNYDDQLSEFNDGELDFYLLNRTRHNTLQQHHNPRQISSEEHFAWVIEMLCDWTAVSIMTGIYLENIWQRVEDTTPLNPTCTRLIRMHISKFKDVVDKGEWMHEKRQ